MKYKRQPKTSHGAYGTQFYRAWASMKNRCNNERGQDYADYGGRGIQHDPRWVSFEVFYLEMFQDFKEGLTLDRIDTNGNYTRENCRWASRKVQANNRRIRKDGIVINGHPLPELAREAGVKYVTAKWRFYQGKSLEQILK